MSYCESSDYCSCTLFGIYFYYGYEVEEDGEWCFIAVPLYTGREKPKEIVRYKCSELTNKMFELSPNLFAGINKMFQDGLIELKLKGKE